jgi:hypothetical protein
MSKTILRAVALSALVCLLGFGNIMIAQYANVRVSSATSTSPEEVTIAVNPANPLNLAAGANLTFYYYSTNGGLNWTQSNLTSTYGVYGDPCVRYDAQGNLYYGHLSNTGGSGWLDRIVVQKSTNGGATFDNGAGIGLNGAKDQDKEWLAADMTNSAYRNNLYVGWTQFDTYGSSNRADSSRILFSRSTDLGATWSAPVRISDRAGNCIDSDSTVEGATPAVGPNGEVYLTWSGPLGIMFDKSTDGGVTFGTDIFVSSQPGGWDFDIPGIYRCNGMPVTLCDVSNSPYKGAVYVVWSDQRNGLDNTDVFLMKSTNSGQTWQSFKKVNDDFTTSQQFFHWATIDQTTGFIYVVFYDRRNTTGNATDVYVARSTDGGETFSNFKVSASSFTPVSNVFFGDYIDITAFNRKVYPIWMRMDGTALSVWTALITDTTTVGVSEEAEQIADFKLMQNYPNPFNPSTTIEYTLGTEALVTLVVSDILGREVTMLVNGKQHGGPHQVQFDGSDLASGIYYYTLRTNGYTLTKKLQLIK